MLRIPQKSTLFPYTTLFRSTRKRSFNLSMIISNRLPALAAQSSVRVALRVASSGRCDEQRHPQDRKSTRLNSSHVKISYAVFCLEKKEEHEAHAILLFCCYA